MRRYKVTLILITIGVACFIAFNIIGSSVSEDGTLIEPFGLIPIGYIFILLGILSFLAIFIISRFRSKK
jgi:hypothetical protein